MADKWRPNPPVAIEPKVRGGERLYALSNQIGKSVLWQRMRDALARGDIKLPTPEEQRAELERSKMVWIDEASSISTDWFKERWSQFWRERDEQIRDCLGRWVSECEPTQIMRDHVFLGLGLEGGDGSVIIAAKPAQSAPVWFGVDWGIID